MGAFVELIDVKKIYRMGEVEIHAAAGIDFSVEKGEFAVIVPAHHHPRGGPASVLRCTGEIR